MDLSSPNLLLIYARTIQKTTDSKMVRSYKWLGNVANNGTAANGKNMPYAYPVDRILTALGLVESREMGMMAGYLNLL